MPDTDPAYYDAVDEVVGSRQADAEWDADEMRSALIDVAKGVSQNQASDGREFSQSLVSKRWADVEDVYDQIKHQQEQESSLFRDPLEEAIGGFEEFFGEMNDKYEMGINSRAIQMMVDEIQDAEQLPAPMYVEKFLRGTNSGVTGADVDYIQRRYEQWLESFQREKDAGAGMPGGMGNFGGANVQQQQGHQQTMNGGVPIGGGSQQPQQPQGQSPQQPQGQQPQKGPPEDPRVAELREEMEEIKSFLADQAQEEPEAQMVEIEEGEQVIRMPLQQAIEAGYLDDGEDEEDFLDKMVKMREAGVIPDPNAQQDDDDESLVEQVKKMRELGLIDDGGEEEMAGAIGEAIESLGEKQMQAQQQMSQNFSNVLQQMRQVQEDDDEDLSMEDVQAAIENTLKEDEVDKLEKELQQMRSEFQQSIEQVARSSNEGVEDTEYLKTDREMQFREHQLETLNENIRELPKQVSMAMREGIVPAFKELNASGPGATTPLWSPPQQQNHGQPGYTPQTVAPNRPEPGPEPGPEPEPEPRPAPQESQAQPEPRPAPQPEHPSMGQEEPDSDTQERSRKVREKLNLTDGGVPEEAEA